MKRWGDAHEGAVGRSNSTACGSVHDKVEPSRIRVRWHKLSQAKK
jgi:hypothetical protein